MDKIPICKVCGEETKMIIEAPGIGISAFTVERKCLCIREREARAAEKQQLELLQQKIEKLKQEGLPDASLRCMSFQRDRYADSFNSKICRNYVVKWGEIQEENIGLLLYGGVGTGKTFYAACIANGLIEKAVPVCMTSVPKILNELQSCGFEKERYFARLRAFDLLIIDDLGVERQTSYALEQLYSVIDERLKAMKPLIVTTNLSLEELKRPISTAPQVSNMDLNRIYDRVLELCNVQLRFDGASKRAEKRKEKTEIAKKILRGEPDV